MLEVDEHTRTDGGHTEPHNSEEFSFLLETYYRLTDSLSVAAGGLRPGRGDDDPADWSIFQRLEELLGAHRALHRWLKLTAELDPNHGADHLAALCARITAAVLYNQHLACHIHIDDAALPGSVIRRFGLLLYEIVQVLSVDALYLRRDGVRLQIELRQAEVGWLATVRHRADANSLGSQAVLTTVTRAARRVAAKVDSEGTEAWCSVTVVFAGSGARNASPTFR